MKNKYWAIKIDGAWFVDVDLQGDSPEAKFSCTNKIEHARLFDEKTFKGMVLAIGGMFHSAKITGFEVEIESEIVESSDEYVVKFDSVGEYMIRPREGGVSCTKNLDCAGTFSKEHAEAWAKHYEAYSTLDILADRLQGTMSIVPVKRTIGEPKEI